MRSIVWLATLLIAASLFAQPRGRIPPYLQPGRLNEEEGARVIEGFRQVGLAGDFVFAVKLVHEPYRAATQSYDGLLAGGWGGYSMTRLDLEPLPGEDSPRRFLYWSGPEPRIWSMINGEIQPIEGDRLHRPLIPDISLTPYDLHMPFIYWRDYAYEGSSRLRGRGVHFFLLYPPADNASYEEIGAVRVAIDADFNVAVRAETLDHDGRALRRLDVQSVKKVQNQWIVRRLDLIDLESRDRTRLEVVGARLSLQLPESILQPEGLQESMPPVDLEAL